MAQHGVVDTEARSRSLGNPPRPTHDCNGVNGSSVGLSSQQQQRRATLQGANPELLLSMMNCVDTALFSPQQLHNWEQMKLHIKASAQQGVPLVVPFSPVDMLPPKAAAAVQSHLASQGNSNTPEGDHAQGDFRQPLHREASILDVLSCLLDQQPPSARVMTSNGSNVLLSSEMKNRNPTQMEEPRPTLKSLLSSNDFSMTEKKESLKHLLSFIDNSFAAHPEPMTDVYKESKDGQLKRLSSLQLMRSFIAPYPNAQGMGRTTSFEIIQAMLNATSNQTIQKPMSSQDSFRFQHLASCLESIETEVGIDNEDYGEAVQVDNLDTLLDYHSPTHAQAAMAAAAQGHSGFVDTQTLLNPHGRGGSFPHDFANQQQGTNGGGYPQYLAGAPGQQQVYGTQFQSYGGTNGLGQPNMDMLDNLASHGPQAIMYNNSSAMKTEQHVPGQQHGVLPPPHQYSQAQYHAKMMATASPQALFNAQQAAYGNVPSALQQQHFSALLAQQQQAQAAMLRTSAQVKQQKQDAQGGVQLCSALGCNHIARVKGMCKQHGGGRRCKVEGCMKSAQTGHLCIAHGGGKPCNVEGCPKTAQSRGLCKQHGGGVRCKFEGCTKSCQSGGFCRGHGGGKRCEFPNCTKWAQKNGHCAKHAQEVAQQMKALRP